MKKLYLFVFSVILFLGYMYKDTPHEAEFKPPISPYGLAYHAGNLGGQPVLLSEQVQWLEYEDSPRLVRENRYKGYKPPPRDFNSVITSFSIDMKYTTGLVFVGYGGAPEGSEAARTAKESQKQYRAEEHQKHNEWVTIMTNAGVRYRPNLTAFFLNNTLDSQIQSHEQLKKYHYASIYIPANKEEFGLEKYNPHPDWVSSDGYPETKDMYVEKDNRGKVITLIFCKNKERNNLEKRCHMYWNIEPFMKVQLEALFNRVHLKDWRLIQERSEKIIKDLAVDPKTISTN
ncbi:hypothetical protein [Acinetobacter tianfuensis]|uniref:Uncharacterized protein n=1 Tax=Acinetobacter tianfuensis TaxID=2419603 RepID=A0A3A8E9R4_9GAMM|nr:hypothetical protein [Acinetobacter tianfuensis]RKG30336.1 hypothetical protein D7V32_11680 [Acinetobacter tianfuensis]